MKKNKIFSNLRKHDYLIFIIISLISLIGLIFIILSFKSNNSSNKEYSYQVNKSSDYKVFLKSNPFFEENTLEKEKYYISNLIDCYKIDFIYDFKGNRKNTLKYKYNIEASISSNIDDLNEKEIWRRRYIIKKDTTKINFNKDFKLEEEVKIKYDYYNNLVNNFENTYNINTNSYLKVRFNITYNLGGEDIQDYIELDITLGDKVSYAFEDYKKTTTKDLENSNSEISYLEFLLGIFLNFIAFSIFYLNKKHSDITPYMKKKKNILREYQDVIVEVSNNPRFDNLKILKVSSFDNLVDIAYGHDSHIIFYETIKDKESNFYVIIDSYVYMFTLKV